MNGAASAAPAPATKLRRGNLIIDLSSLGWLDVDANGIIIPGGSKLPRRK
jgi:hypothetical protein